MPFWWRRRRKPWWGRWYRRRKTFKRRKRYHRRRPRRPLRRRRRRRRKRKVRRKRQTITVKQWQPDSIVKCKIRGFGTLVKGSEGKQYECYTQSRGQYVPPKGPSGGGFGAEVFSLQGLYEQYNFRKNIWTKSNILKDLVRYLYVNFTFYRHDHVDFVVAYERQPPFNIEKFTYTQMHPSQLLLQKHRKVVLSTKTKPNGKVTTKMHIRPPKQMLTKWFFTDSFCHFPLLLLKASACSLNYPMLGCCSQSNQVNIFYLNPTFYVKTGWGFEAATANPYKPNSMHLPFTYKYMDGKTTKTITFNQPSSYAASVSYDKGWFTPSLLNAIEITDPKQDALPILVGRYIPSADTGVGNKCYWVSVVKSAPIEPSDTVLTMHNVPLWLALFGYQSYIELVKKDKTFLNTHYLVVECSAIHIFKTQTIKPQIILVDQSFINGNAPFGEYLTQTAKTSWYPTVIHQQETINQIVESGPFIPKLQNQTKSSWELDYFYSFFFKWGGPLTTDPEVADPSKLPSYDVPDTMQGRLQIINPAKQAAASILHPWDSRRGFITARALKRISENTETDTDFLPDPEDQPKKKKAKYTLRVPEQENQEIKDCLLSLCEEPTCQEAEEGNLKQLIIQQKQQQQQLKRNILKIITELKKKQRMLQLQTGMLE
nr:MAG: ORF1 [Torque teno midi virus]